MCMSFGSAGRAIVPTAASMVMTEKKQVVFCTNRKHNHLPFGHDDALGVDTLAPDLK